MGLTIPKWQTCTSSCPCFSWKPNYEKTIFWFSKLISIDKIITRNRITFVHWVQTLQKRWQTWQTCFQKCCMKQLHYISIIELHFHNWGTTFKTCNHAMWWSRFWSPILWFKKNWQNFQKISKISWIYITNPKKALEENSSGFGGHCIGTYFLLSSPRTSPNVRLSPWLPPPPRPLISGTALP